MARKIPKRTFEDGLRLGRAHGVDLTLCRVTAWAMECGSKTGKKYACAAAQYAKDMEYPPREQSKAGEEQESD